MLDRVEQGELLPLSLLEIVLGGETLHTSLVLCQHAIELILLPLAGDGVGHVAVHCKANKETMDNKGL